MTVYIVAAITIHDRAGYDRYASRFFATLKGTGGRLLASDEEPQVLEGEWTGSKVNLISFPDRASAEAWYRSEAYQEIAKDRLASTDGVIWQVTGLGDGS